MGLEALFGWLSEPDDIKVPSVQTPSSSSYKGSILILGAGTAGLFAAYTLEHLQHAEYEILEATAAFGGRVAETTDYLDVPLDLGAEWIHGQAKVLDDLLPFPGTDTVETIVYQPQTFHFHGAKFLWLRRLRLWRWFYRETKFKSTTWFQYLRVRDYIVSRIPSAKLTFNSPVTSIDTSSADKIRVTTADGSVRVVDKVIVATPLPVLQSGMIAFTPPLPSAKQTALDTTVCHKGLKVWLEFDHKFYTDIAIAGTFWDFLQARGGLFIDALFRKPTSKFAVMYFDVSAEVEALIQMSDEDLVKKLVGDLDTLSHAGATTTPL